MPNKKKLLWWRNDLRIHDNKSLQKAIEGDDELVHVFFWKDEWDIKTSIGYPRLSDHRKNHLEESLQDLQSSLKSLGAELLILKAPFKESLQILFDSYAFEEVYAEEGICDEERAEEKSLQNLTRAKLILDDKASLFPPETIPFDIMGVPDVFTQFRKKLEKNSISPNPLPEPKSIPKNPDIGIKTMPLKPTLKVHKNAAIQIPGGEKAGQDHLKKYVWEDQLIASYKQTRNGLIGQNYSSKFSPFLAQGSLSARLIYQEVKKFEKQVKSNSSTYWLVFELIWRDYFRYIARKYGSRIFQLAGLKENAPSYSHDEERFRAWTLGKTTDPFVNANMIELKETGFMSNRGRQNVASYLVHDLGIDWRWGAMWFEHQLIDYDPHCNWGNWIYVAGVGNDPRPNRQFNTRLQAERYDPKGEYQKLWLHE